MNVFRQFFIFLPLLSTFFAGYGLLVKEAMFSMWIVVFYFKESVFLATFADTEVQVSTLVL